MSECPFFGETTTEEVASFLMQMHGELLCSMGTWAGMRSALASLVVFHVVYRLSSVVLWLCFRYNSLKFRAIGWCCHRGLSEVSHMTGCHLKSPEWGVSGRFVQRERFQQNACFVLPGVPRSQYSVRVSGFNSIPIVSIVVPGWRCLIRS